MTVSCDWIKLDLCGVSLLVRVRSGDGRWDDLETRQAEVQKRQDKVGNVVIPFYDKIIKSILALPLRKKSSQLQKRRLRRKILHRVSIRPRIFLFQVAEVILAWVRCVDVEDVVSGPIYVLCYGGDYCLTLSEDNRFGLQRVNLNETGHPEPSLVQQVLVCHRVGETDKIAFKSAWGRYVASDKFGQVSAEREAIGPQEEWLAILREDGMAFESYLKQYLRVDLPNKIRADSESVGFNETFLVFCQAEKRKRRKSVKEDTHVSVDSELQEMYVTNIIVLLSMLFLITIDL